MTTKAPSLSKTVANLDIPEDHKLCLLNKVARLELPEDVKCKLVTMVKDKPPREGVSHISVALATNAIDPGLAQESLVLKAARLLLWSLIYFPGQFIQYHLFMRWCTGQKIQEDSDIVALFRKNLRKLDRIIVGFSLRCVGLVKSRKNSKPESVDGFRVSRDGTDYTDKVAKQSKRKVNRALSRYEESLSEDRVRADDVNNPAMQAFIVDEKESLLQLHAAGTIKHFAMDLPQLPCGGSSDDGSGEDPGKGSGV